MLSLSELNRAILHTDLQLVVSHLGSYFNISMLDKSGNTLLHNSAYGGRKALVVFLLNNGANVHQMNSFGLTPLQLARYGGHTEVAAILQEHIQAYTTGGHCPADQESSEQGRMCSRYGNSSNEWLDPLKWEQYLSSQWLGSRNESTAFLRQLPKCACELPVLLGTSLSWEEFSMRFFATRQPVLLTGLMDQWPAWKNWKKKKLLERYE